MVSVPYYCEQAVAFIVIFVVAVIIYDGITTCLKTPHKSSDYYLMYKIHVLWCQLDMLFSNCYKRICCIHTQPQQRTRLNDSVGSLRRKLFWCTAYCSRINALCPQQDNVILRTIQDPKEMMFSSCDIPSWFSYRINIVKGMQEHVLLHSYSHLVADDMEIVI